MPASNGIFTPDTFRFFRDLSRNNKTAWMNAHRERYKEHVVAPFRRLLEELTQPVLALDPNLDTCGRTGVSFSRINRDTRFAKDKTPYRPQMYLMFPAPFSGGEGGQLYVAANGSTVTVGFRIYAGDKRKASALAVIAEPRVSRESGWLVKQKRKLSRRYESYWYAAEKGEWNKHDGWPATTDDWMKIRGWVVRRKLRPAAAVQAGFVREITKTFRELYPLVRFTSIRA